MCKSLDNHHLPSSPHYHQSNDLVERYVRIEKNMITKASETAQSIHMALPIYRNMSLSAKAGHPIQLLFQRQSYTNLPINSLVRRGQIHRDDRPSQFLMKPNPQKAKKDLHIGQPVMVTDPQTKTWDEGVVTNVIEEPQSHDFSS